jgi:hypothetical protein
MEFRSKYLWLISWWRIRHNSGSLKVRLIKAGILKNVCFQCGQPPLWRGKPLTLELEHRNGNRTDNRIENLEIICPHCHSQTTTFRGRNANRGVMGKRVCPGCAGAKSKEAKLCIGCCKIRGERRKNGDESAKREAIQLYGHEPRGKYYQPLKFTISEDVLKEMIETIPITTIAKRLGVSDSAVIDRCKKYGIKRKPRGYWTKFETKFPYKTNRKYDYEKIYEIYKSLKSVTKTAKEAKCPIGAVKRVRNNFENERS